jgi:pimeloyl-ACP methyl ester carboxylesterase
MGGHSMGAAQTMMEAGATGRVTCQRGSQRFDAYIAVSPQGPGSWAFDDLNAWSGVAAPVLVLTGTEDSGLDGTTPQSRMQVFTLLPPGKKRLGVVVGADHFELAGRRGSSEGEVAAAIAGEFLVQLRRGWVASSPDMPRRLAQVQDR